MERIAAALWGLCAAQTVPADSRQEAADAAGMSLCMAESICVRETIDPEDMLARLRDQHTIQPQEKSLNRPDGSFPPGFTAAMELGSSADRMLPVAVYLYLKYGEGLLLYQSALDDIASASAVTHTSPEAIAESQLYCGILGILLAGRSLREAVKSSVSILRKYYYFSREYERVCKVLDSVSTEDDVHLQYFQLDASGTFRTTLDWATYLLCRSGSYRQCVLQSAQAPVPEPRLLCAAVGTLAALREGFESLPEDWMKRVPDKNRVARCCDGLFGYWCKIVRKRGIGYGCKEEDRWQPRTEPERKRVEAPLLQQ